MKGVPSPFSSSFEIRVPGKWVLSGEHAVLRGVPAIALPHPEFSLDLRFDPNPAEMFVTAPTEARELAVGLIEAVHRITQLPSGGEPQGRLEIRSSIPFGAGLGSSAALCVAIVRWLAPAIGIEESRIRETATRLEDRFHGKSSGMDVAVISEAAPIRFELLGGERRAETLGLSRLPKFSFHDTGLRKKTSECIARVERFRAERPEAGARCDVRMGSASELALRGLRAFAAAETQTGLNDLREAMRLGQECFREWDLVPEAALEIERRLYAEGARAVKLTGAGGGGYLVALWD